MLRSAQSVPAGGQSQKPGADRQRFYPKDISTNRALALAGNVRPQCIVESAVRGYGIDFRCNVAICGVDNNPGARHCEPILPRATDESLVSRNSGGRGYPANRGSALRLCCRYVAYGASAVMELPTIQFVGPTVRRSVKDIQKGLGAGANLKDQSKRMGEFA
jgi:hypothetical protein